MKLTKLWELSSRLEIEIFLGSRVKAAGNRQEAIVERYRDDISQVKSSSRFNSIIISLILIVPAFLAVSTIQESLSLIGTIDITKIYFNTTLAISIYYLFNLIFMLLFGMMTLANLLEGQVFKFLHTLPLSKTEIQLLGIMTFVRLLFYQLLIMAFAFPIGILVVTQSIPIFLVTFVINFFNLSVISYVLIIVVDKLRSYLFQQEKGFSLKSILRYLFFLIYLISTFAFYYFIGALSSLLSQLYEINLFPIHTLALINKWLVLIPFPFSTSYVLNYIILQQVPTIEVILTSVLGMLLFAVLTWRILKSGNKILLQMAFNQSGDTETSRDMEHEIQVTRRQPLPAYMRMSLVLIVRDLSALMSITMAMLFPLIPLVQDTGPDPMVNFIFYAGFIIFFANNALTSSEGSIGDLISSLPFSHFDMYRGKQLVLSGIFLISYIVFSAVSLGRFLTLRWVFLIIVLALLLPPVFLMTKSYMFGQLNNEFTLYTIEDDSNFFRNIILIIPVMMLVGIQYALFFAQDLSGLNIHPDYYYGVGVFNVVLTLFAEYTARKMFN